MCKTKITLGKFSFPVFFFFVTYCLIRQIEKPRKLKDRCRLADTRILFLEQQCMQKLYTQINQFTN
jgi:hypothetical protein